MSLRHVTLTFFFILVAAGLFMGCLGDESEVESASASGSAARAFIQNNPIQNMDISQISSMMVGLTQMADEMMKKISGIRNMLGVERNAEQE